MSKKRLSQKVNEMSPEAACAVLFGQGIIGPWILDPHQIEVYDAFNSLPATTNEAFFHCSRQFGKSFLDCVIAAEECVKYPGSIVRIASNTKEQAEEIVELQLPKLQERAPKGFVREMKSKLRWKIGYSTLRLGTFARAHVDSLRGGNGRLIIMEEGGFAKTDDYEYALRNAVGPQLTRTMGRLLHVSTSSEDPNHLLHREVGPKCKLMGSYWHRTIYQNTSLSQAHIDNCIKLCGGTHTESWMREYLCQVIRSPSLMCLPDWNASAVVREFSWPEYAFWWIVMDTGGTMDKTFGFVVTYDFLRNKLLAWDEETFEPNTNSRKIVDGMRAMEARVPRQSQPEDRYGDGSGQLLIDLEELYQYKCLLPPKHDFSANLNALQVAVGALEWEIHPRCKFLIATCEAGLLSKDRKTFARTPTLGHCDAIAALMYANRLSSIMRTKNPIPRAAYDPTRVLVRAPPTGQEDGLLALAKMAKNHDRRK